MNNLIQEFRQNKNEDLRIQTNIMMESQDNAEESESASLSDETKHFLAANFKFQKKIPSEAIPLMSPKDDNKQKLCKILFIFE